MYMIVVVDYGMGNLHSIAKALEFVGAEVLVSNKKEDLELADKIVLPGVGAFRDGMMNLQKNKLDKILFQEVIKKKKPFLGVCLGMQLLADKSNEFGNWKGLGFIPGEVKKFDVEDTLKIPHIGWNNVEFIKDHPVLSGIKDNSDFYFVHSYCFTCKDQSHIYGKTDYGGLFTSIIVKDNIFAVQFHPEKSQKDGLTLLSNFTKWEYVKK